MSTAGHFPMRILFIWLILAGSPQAMTLVYTQPAPASLQALIQTYFVLPAAPLQDETARATFLRRAQREIGELLASEGYFTPAITADDMQVLTVTPGPLTRVTQVNIEFTGDLSADLVRSEKLRAAWHLKVSAPFRSEDWEKAKTALLDLVSREDYAAASIERSQAEADPATASASLTVVIHSGPAFRFGDLTISGLERYNKSLVLRQMPFHAGDAYQRNLLLLFQSRLQNMPQFASVMVNIDPDPAKHQAAQVKVVLTETRTRRLSAGLGASTNNGARSEINYLDHNFLGSAWNLSSGLRLEQNRQTFTSSIDTLPDDNGYLLSWGLADENTLIEGLKTATQKLAVTRSRTQGQIETRTSLSWQQEQLIPAGGIAENDQALVPDWQWHRRAVDDLLYPRQGNSSEFRIGGGSRQLMSNSNFLRSYVREQLWWPMGLSRDTLSLRGEFGYTAANSSNGIPQDYLFRAGGSQSVRGYNYQSLGIPQGTAVVGGRVLSTASLEYTHWLNNNWGIAVFTDSGGVADTLSALRLSTGYGSGVRWRSPAGPLALDLAQGQNALQLHFSLAVAF